MAVTLVTRGTTVKKKAESERGRRKLMMTEIGPQRRGQEEVVVGTHAAFLVVLTTTKCRAIFHFTLSPMVKVKKSKF